MKSFISMVKYLIIFTSIFSSNVFSQDCKNELQEYKKQYFEKGENGKDYLLNIQKTCAPGIQQDMYGIFLIMEYIELKEINNAKEIYNQYTAKDITSSMKVFYDAYGLHINFINSLRARITDTKHWEKIENKHIAYLNKYSGSPNIESFVYTDLIEAQVILRKFEQAKQNALIAIKTKPHSRQYSLLAISEYYLSNFEATYLAAKKSWR